MTQLDPDLESRYEEVVAKVRSYFPDPDLDALRRAFEYAADKHSGQTRKSGEPYIKHPLEVTHIAADMHMDIHSLCAALLHDTVEDTDATVEDIAARFGDQPAMLVDGLTKISKLAFKSREDAQAENIRKLIITMGRDLRVILIKLADRLHNLRTLDHMSEAKQRIIALETLEIYAPIANRLGVNWMKTELEDLSFRYTDPEAYYDLARRIQGTRADRQNYIRETLALLRQEMDKNQIECEISGRPKHFFSIAKKMQKSGVDVDELHDLTAFRVIVKTTAACYEALGLSHAMWKPVPGRFKDYIAIPKPNGYQSLHTTVLGPRGQRVEIQIRTAEMHRVAELGVAAHWAYKEGRSVISADASQFSWLREFAESREFHDSREFLDSVKLDLFADEVFVFTPAGDVLSLPKGSTPLDFAYRIHSKVGNHAVHAKVNGRGVGLRHELQTGDRVEILTRADQRPREEWLDIAQSAGAKAKIRQAIRQEARVRARELGKDLLSSELKRYGVRYEAALKNGDLQAAAEILKVQNVEQLLAAVGFGKLPKESVVQKIVPPELIPKDEKPAGPIRKFGERLAALINRPPKRTGVRLAGMEGDVLVSYGRCCNPVYGDEIVGYVTRGRGVVVHASHCPRILNLETERRIEVQWEDLDQAGDDKTKRRVNVRVVARDAPGLLSVMSSAFASRGVNIAQAHCRTLQDGMATNVFEVLVANVGQLKEAMRTVAKVDGVISVDRV